MTDLENSPQQDPLQEAGHPDAQVKMHAGEVDIDAELVKRLLAGQFPHLADRPVKVVRSTGTVNAIFRLGADLCVRLPRVAAWAESIEREWTWLPVLAPHLSLSIPQPLAKGKPVDGYPFSWAIYHWIEGSPYQDDLITDERQLAVDLAFFIRQLRGIDTRGAPHGGRLPLAELDAETRTAIDSCSSVLDAEAVNAAWVRALEAPLWDGSAVWMHGDLLTSNLLLRDGRLHAVLDFGGAGAGDLAADVVPAWSVFSPTGRVVFREALGVDEATWRRARGYALHQALMIIPYYPHTNPEFVRMALRTVEQVLGS